MINLKQIYRSTYAGENIVTKLNMSNNDWSPEVEFVPNQVSNTHTTKQAVAIGNGESRKNFDLIHIARHTGGLLAVDRIQSYGCNALARDFAPDFLVAVGNEMVAQLVDGEYTKDHIVYANAEVVLKYPGQFYLLPQNPYLDAGALAVYMACFDGHKKVFMIGYDQYVGEEPVNNIYKDTLGYPASTETQNAEFFTRSLASIMNLYPEVEFIRVMPQATHHVHDTLRVLPNFRQIDYRRFSVEADIG
jgi:hypothetical protein